MWYHEKVFYQIYTLNFCGAPFDNDGNIVHRITRVNDFVDYFNELGIGGRLIAKKVAEALNISFYDNELIDETARELGIDIDTIRKASQEKSSSFAYSLNNGPLVLPINDQVYATQAKIIKHLAEKEDCIIVNGCANYILEDYPNVLRIFVYAPFESRLNRVVNDYKEEHDNPKKYVQKRDKQRKSYYNYYTTNTWATMKDYDLCINSDMGIDDIAALITKVYQNGHLWKNK